MIGRNLSKRELQIFWLCLLLFLVYISYTYLLRPLNEKKDTLSGQIEVALKRIQRNSQVLEQDKVIEEQSRLYLANFKQQYSDEQEMTSILSEVEKAALELGMQITDLKPRKVKKEKFYKEFSVNVMADGEFQDLLQFLYTIQSQPYSFNIEDIRLEKRMEWGEVIKCQLILNRLFLSEN